MYWESILIRRNKVRKVVSDIFSVETGHARWYWVIFEALPRGRVEDRSKKFINRSQASGFV